MAALVAQGHDDKGLCWPLSVAPYHIHLLGLDLNKAEIRQCGEGLYADRPGLPVRVVVSKRSCAGGGLELKRRKERVSRMVPLDEAVQTMREEGRRGMGERR